MWSSRASWTKPRASRATWRTVTGDDPAAVDSDRTRTPTLSRGRVARRASHCRGGLSTSGHEWSGGYSLFSRRRDAQRSALQRIQTRRRLRIVGDEEIDLQSLARIDAVG